MTVSYEEARADVKVMLRVDERPFPSVHRELIRALLSGPPEPSEEARYAALGRACESNGLGWYIEDGTMRFQAPADIIEDRALASRPAVAEGWVLVPVTPTREMLNE